MLYAFTFLPASYIVLSRTVCRRWCELLCSPSGVELLLKVSKLYVVSPYMVWDTYAGEEDHSPLVVRAFTRRNVVLDILRRYREKWRQLLFWGGNYRDDSEGDDQKIVAAIEKLQDDIVSVIK